MTDFEKTYQNYNPRQTALDEARALLTAAAKAAMVDGTLPEAELPAFIVEIPADVKNGDIASNIAMAGARTWRKAPKMIADALIAHLPALDGGVFAKVEVAGPGFINLFLAPSFWAGVVLGACSNKEYGRTDHGKGAKYNVEFVSANPTGPMHMGNARGGALGDCLAAVLDWSGYDVTREFYINDAGNQIQKFGKSLAVRYLQKYCGEEAYPLPAECYQGGDIKVLAGEFAELNGDKYVASCKGMDEETLFESEAFAALKDALVAYALPKNIAALKRDLGKYRIDYDVWFHESTLHESGAVLAVVDKLLELGACYKAEDGAIMYRSAQYAAKYGTVNKKKTDDGTEEEAKDEVLVRANGIPTYFAADIAYHYNKLATRGFAKAIDVWGADHHGHVARMKGAMDAIGLHGEDLDVVLMQMVNLMRDGQPVRMSKRTGNAITLTDLLEEVPIDSARFLFNMHDAGSGIDFDLDQAVKTDNDNPVYYVQYAHARICSILKKMESEGVAFAGAENIDATLLTEPSEMDLIRMLAAFPQEIVMAAEKYDPSRINRFVIDLASAFHRFYGSCRIQGADPAVQQARLALCIGVKNVIFNVLTMFKINVPEKMYATSPYLIKSKAPPELESEFRGRFLSCAFGRRRITPPLPQSPAACRSWDRQGRRPAGPLRPPQRWRRRRGRSLRTARGRRSQRPRRPRGLPEPPRKPPCSWGRWPRRRPGRPRSRRRSCRRQGRPPHNKAHRPHRRCRHRRLLRSRRRSRPLRPRHLRLRTGLLQGLPALRSGR